MSVRRLADDSVQPAIIRLYGEEFELGQTDHQETTPRASRHLLSFRYCGCAQEQHDGWVSRAAMEEVGRMLDMPFIRVYEIATFYTMFQLAPVGKKAHVQVCGTTPAACCGARKT